MIESEWIWLDGKFVPWHEAQVHALTHSLHYGCSLFEGIRCYETENGPAVFRLEEHYDRLFDSAKIVAMAIPYTKEELLEATLQLIHKNGSIACYIRPLVFYGYGVMGLNPTGSTVQMMIATWPWGAYLGEEGLKNGIRVKTSSFTRHHPNVTMTKAKVGGNYVNSTLAKLEAVRDGYAEALMLDTNGFVVEGSGENIFIVENGRLITPPLHSCLNGLTRGSVIELARCQGIPTIEDSISRDRLYVADEVFLTGTAAELVPITEADNRTIADGTPGPITQTLQDRYRKVILGQDQAYLHWRRFAQ